MFVHRYRLSFGQSILATVARRSFMGWRLTPVGMLALAGLLTLMTLASMIGGAR